jgi:uncharacterized zinc-type alcohol dehydrogenase-like protein
MLEVNAYAAASPTEPLGPTTITRRGLGAHDVLIEIKYTGICHSDIHHARSHWREETYPMVPGHEIAGVVSAVGAEVTKHQVGDRVGVGCMANSCGECANCRDGREQYCLQGVILTYGSIDKDGSVTYGGYSTHIVVNEDFVLRIPHSLELDVAAPLLCAGITTYSPLRRFGTRAGKKVAVVGLGGLGHLAVKLARAMGAQVTVLSQSLKKREDGLRLGADHYYATSDADTFSSLAGSLDLIINTVGAEIDLDGFLSLLAPDGVLVTLSGPPTVSVHTFSLLSNGRSLAGSFMGGIAETQEMLDFCGSHRLGAEIEVIRAEQINEAYARMESSDVRFRFVIDIASLT